MNHVLIITALLGGLMQPRAGSTDPVTGTTMRWTWTSGPTAHSTHEHTFKADGSMDWRILDGPARGKAGHEKKYAVVKAADDTYAVSYLSHSGFTVTVVLNFRNGRMVGFASNATEWHPVDGTFEVVK